MALHQFIQLLARFIEFNFPESIRSNVLKQIKDETLGKGKTVRDWMKIMKDGEEMINALQRRVNRASLEGDTAFISAFICCMAIMGEAERLCFLDGLKSETEGVCNPDDQESKECLK